ncbi:MAG: SPOR domain-containing protein [Gammaproteobacteria bacterium]|nr:SPOR domain-containing protein [Gammaproteobacteria bacterium]
MTVIHQHWLKTVPQLLLLTIVLCVPTLQAASVVNITRLKPPVWVQQGEIKSKLTRDVQLGAGDEVITGVAGSVELQLGDDFSLQVKSGSRVTYISENVAGIPPRGGPQTFSISKGVVCMQSSLELEKGSKVAFDISNTMLGTMQHTGDVCVKRSKKTSSVLLRSGSVQIEHYATGHMIVLSKRGTEFRVADGDEYELLTFDVSDNSILESAASANSEEIIPEEVQSDKKDNALADNSEKTEKPANVEVVPSTGQNQPEFEYIVYLLSYSSERRAEETNSKLREAGYKTSVSESQGAEKTYYRIARPGFETRKAAEHFSRSIIGKLGVTDTWIDKARLLQ